MRSVQQVLMVSLGVFLVSGAGAINYPPYEVYPYVADSTDNPPVNYMKVVEPGRTGETNASYVVLGISYPKTYQAVAASYAGDLVVPAYIDGLPVRKLNEAAFVTCSRITSIHLPATLREVGDRAFSDCYSLTNVTFESGVSVVGNSVFSNCVALTSVRFPKSLSRLGAGCFQGCLELRDVYFDGNAPRLAVTTATEKSPLGESIFRNYGYYERVKVHINRNTFGWISPYEKGVPEKWPVDCGFMQAHETVAEEDGTVSVAASGFVAVITEIKGGPVVVPETWTKQFPTYATQFGTDFAASLTRATGKKDASGNALVVWQDYVAGTDPTDPADRFTATITLVNGRPVIHVLPELSATEKAKRTYTIYGKRRLADTDWTTVPATQTTDCNFFKVTVQMK